MRTTRLYTLLLATMASTLFAFGQIYTPEDDIYYTPTDKNTIVEKARMEKKPTQVKLVQPPVETNSERDVDEYNRRYAPSWEEESEPQPEVAYTTNNEQEGYYLNGFNGSDSDYEYAERIRRFHNPQLAIHISEPGYTDIYMLNSSDWNVYVDNSYAWVTPTWSNPYYWNYNFSPYSYNNYAWGGYYNNWGWGGFYRPYRPHYNSWYGFGDPWYYGYGYGYGYRPPYYYPPHHHYPVYYPTHKKTYASNGRGTVGGGRGTSGTSTGRYTTSTGRTTTQTSRSTTGVSRSTTTTRNNGSSSSSSSVSPTTSRSRTSISRSTNSNSTPSSSSSSSGYNRGSSSSSNSSRSTTSSSSYNRSSNSSSSFNSSSSSSVSRSSSSSGSVSRSTGGTSRGR